MSWLMAGRVAGLAPASRALRAVSQASPVVSRIVSRHTVVLQPLCRRPLSRYKLCITTHAPVARYVARLPCVSQRSRAVSQGAGRRIAALDALYRDTRSPPSQPLYNCCIATQLPFALIARRIVRIARRVARIVPCRAHCASCRTHCASCRTHCASCRARARSYHSPTTSCRGRGLAVLWPPRCTSQRAPALPPSLACHNTTCCIVTQS